MFELTYCKSLLFNGIMRWIEVIGNIVWIWFGLWLVWKQCLCYTIRAMMLNFSRNFYLFKCWISHESCDFSSKEVVNGQTKAKRVIIFLLLRREQNLHKCKTATVLQKDKKINQTFLSSHFSSYIYSFFLLTD